ncbi:sensor histidine kinase [Paenibacillus sp. 1011MAR3C5]|uniref:sensor histidine kinase n=1 Tax=Paenibacillus sp. 1011MAR3C5 TaxID=1675787 RepID=UPI000E6BAB3F|nr:sensor histidine kinase [Paenibacillus sp. 1011MAR3C5]RJE87609.1 sensor histidine kinase [Paenibacillus sp. 1011MAR3C5]
MNKWYQIFHRNTGLSPYVWVVFCILPFYFIFRSSSTPEVISGIVMIILFFVCYRLSFVSKGWLVYFWTSVQILISIAMTLLFSYVYFSIFLAFFIGNIQNRAGFFTLYAIHLASTFITVNYGFATQNQLFFTQFPFILISLIVVILLPFNTYNQKKQGQLEGQLEDANKRIAELVKQEERQRIARDLHDTLGQKLSLIGLKSDLAGKLIHKNPLRAQAEIRDVQQTARTALKEVREMVTQMRGARLDEELHRVTQILGAADIELHVVGDYRLNDTNLLTENVLCMSLKEAVTNVVKHSKAKHCTVTFTSTPTDFSITVSDDGVGMSVRPGYYRGNGLRGMKERLEFVNGSLSIRSDRGTELNITVPHVVKRPTKEETSE